MMTQAAKRQTLGRESTPARTQHASRCPTHAAPSFPCTTGTKQARVLPLAGRETPLSEARPLGLGSAVGYAHAHTASTIMAAAEEKDAGAVSAYDDLLETRASSFFFRKGETTGYLEMESFTQASLDTPLPDDNRGMRLLLKMGWKKDTGLGRLGTGASFIVDRKGWS